MKRTISIIAGIAISVLAILWSLRVVDLDSVARSLQSVSLDAVLLASLIYLLGFVWRALRWKLMLSPLAKVGAREAGEVIVLGYGANNVLPLRLGEIVRAYYAGRWMGCQRFGALSSIMAERILDGCMVVMIFAGAAGLTALTNGTALGPDVRDTIILAGGLFAVALAGLVAVAAFGRTVETLLRRWLPGRMMPAATSIIEALHFLRSPRLAAAAVALTLLTWTTEGLVFSVLMADMGLPNPLLAGLFVMATVNLGIVLPSAPGYVGVFQVATIFAFRLLGGDESSALGFSVTVHTVLFVTGTAAALVVMLRREGVAGVRALLTARQAATEPNQPS